MWSGAFRRTQHEKIISNPFCSVGSQVSTIFYSYFMVKVLMNIPNSKWVYFPNFNWNCCVRIEICGSRAETDIPYGKVSQSGFTSTRKSASPFEDITCTSILENPHKSMMRRIVGVNNKSSVDGLHFEFGRYHIYIDIIGRMLDYENRLTHSDRASWYFTPVQKTNL